MMKWIFILMLMISFHVRAEAADVKEAQSAVVGPELQIEQPTLQVTEPTQNVIRESEIPVVLDTSKKTAGNENPFLKIMMTFGILGVLGCAAYFLIKKYVRPGNSPSQANQVRVLSQHYLGPKKSLAIIRVAGESILIGVTDHNISLIKELSLLDDEIPEKTPKTFNSVFNPAQRESSAPIKDEDGLDEFSISGIKDFVSTKLKNMRTLE